MSQHIASAQFRLRLECKWIVAQLECGHVALGNLDLVGWAYKVYGVWESQVESNIAGLLA